MSFRWKRGTARRSRDKIRNSSTEVFRRSETCVDRNDAQISGLTAFLDLLSAELEEHVFTHPSAPERQHRNTLSAGKDVRVRGDSCRFHRRVVVSAVNLLHLDSEYFTIRTVSQWMGWPHQGSRRHVHPAFHGALSLTRWLEPTAQQQRLVT